jgi:hypothetical protein
MYDAHIVLQLASATLCQHQQKTFSISSHLKLIFYKLNLYFTMDTYTQIKFFYTFSEQNQLNKVKIQIAIF